MKITGRLVYEPESGADCFSIRCRDCKFRIDKEPCKIREFCIKDK